MDTPSTIELAIVILWILLAAIAVKLLIGRGVFRHDVFATAPVRGGRLEVVDIAGTLGLFLIGPILLVSAVPGNGGAEVTSNRLASLMLINQLGMVPAACYVIWRSRDGFVGGVRDLGLGTNYLRKAFGPAFLGFFAVIPIVRCAAMAVLLLLMLAGAEVPAIAHSVLRMIVEGPRDVSWWLLIISATVFAPILEEIVFRGMIQSALRHSRIAPDRWIAIAMTSVLFMGIHANPDSIHALPMLYVLSLGLGWAYERTGNLWVPIILHAVFNGFMILEALASN